MSNTTAILLLAAGESSRLGEPKQLLDVDGEPLVRHVARMLVSLKFGPVGVVVGARRERVAAALAGLDVAILPNADWPGGIGSSIATGIRWAAVQNVDAALITLCDQPEIDAAHLRALVDRRTAGIEIVATRYADTLGVPAVFTRSLFDRLLALPPDRGAKSLFTDRSLTVAEVNCEAARIDLDTPGDVARWRTNFDGRA